jgi:hypothetical protein
MLFSTQLQAALVEADPARDRAFRAEAEQFYSKLTNWLKRQKSMKKYRLLKYQRKDDPGKAVYSYEIPPKAFGLGKKYPGFLVVLTPFRTGTARFGKTSDGERAVIMPVLMSDALETESGNEMATNLGYIREVFIHEFIHFLDDLRYKGKPTVASAALKQKGGKAAYYNSPVEFNAYFQGGASEIERHAAKMKPGTFEKKFGRSGTGFRKFRKEFEHLFNKNFRRALAGKWKNKYEVRLWQLHQDMLARDRGVE